LQATAPPMSPSSLPPPRQLLFALLISALTHFKPSEPFLTPYLELYHSHSTVSHAIYPFYTYSLLPSSIILPYLSTFLPYKSLLNGILLCKIVTRFLLLYYPTSLPLMQLMQVIYGISELLPLTLLCYAYRITKSSPTAEPNDFSRATMWINGVALISYFLAAELGQFLHSTMNLPYTVLFYISSATISTAFLLSFFLTPDKTTSGAPITSPSHLLASLQSLYTRPLTFLSLSFIVILTANSLAENYGSNLLCSVTKDCDAALGHIVAATRATAGLFTILAIPLPLLISRANRIPLVLALALGATAATTFATARSYSTLTFTLPYLLTINLTSLTSATIAALTGPLLSSSSYLLLFGANNIAVTVLAAVITAVWSAFEGTEAVLFNVIAGLCCCAAVGLGVAFRDTVFPDAEDEKEENEILVKDADVVI